MYGMVARLDDWGKPAWIAAMIVGLVLFWPIGLLVLGYMIWSGRMGCNSQWGAWGEDRRARWEHRMERMRAKMDRWSGCGPSRNGGFAPTGNKAFDEYRAETMRRLEDEATQFRDFLDQLRQAKDKAEFEQFMAARKARHEEKPRNEPNPPEGETRQ